MADTLKEKQEDDRMTSLALQNIMHSNPQGHDHVSTQNLMRKLNLEASAVPATSGLLKLATL
jgi:hypothetical protein